MNTPDVIYLIDTGDEISWCDDPNPSGELDPDDSVAYVKKEQRITEQDAREIVAEFDSWNSTQYNQGSYSEWYKAEGRALIAKLNGDSNEKPN